MIKRVKSYLIVTVIFALTASLAFLFWGHLPVDGHESFIVGEKALDSTDKKPILDVVSYNIAYGRGAEDDIIVGPRDPEAITANLNGIALLLKARRADIVFLQEVDLASKRTFFIDEAKYISERGLYPYYACVTNWVKNYVPFPYWPPDRHYGRMKSGQCILSKYPIVENERIALPPSKNDPFYYTAFNLSRAVQQAKIIIGEDKLRLINVHLEAFDIENRKQQATFLADMLNKADGTTTIVAGDFNAIPPDAPMKKDFDKQGGNHWREDIDLTNDDSISSFVSLAPALYEAIASLWPNAQMFTYPSDMPNRRLDYIFATKNLKAIDAGTIQKAGVLSDHIPIFADFKMIGE